MYDIKLNGQGTTYKSKSFKEFNLLNKWTSIQVTFINTGRLGLHNFVTTANNIEELEIELTIAKMKEGSQAVIGSNKNLKICLTIEDIDLKPLNDSLQKFLTDHPTVIEQAKTLEAIDAEIKDTSYKDDVGGVHDEGLGWNPQGAFCGECGSLTCKGCINQYYTV